METVTFGKFSHINNIKNPWELDDTELVSATNFDIDNAKRLITRTGQIAGPSISLTYLWSTHDQTRAYALQGTDLVKINNDLSTTVVKTDFGSTAKFTENGATVYVTNGTVIGFIENGAYTEFTTITDDFFGTLPGGTDIEFHKNRLYTAIGSVLRFSEVGRPGVTDKRKGFKQLPDPIDTIIEVEGGLYISCGGAIYFLPGDNPHKFVMKHVVQFGVIPGTKKYVKGHIFGDASETDIFATFAGGGGIWIAKPDGNLVSLTGSKYLVPDSAGGTSVVFGTVGSSRLITVLT